MPRANFSAPAGCCDDDRVTTTIETRTGLNRNSGGCKPKISRMKSPTPIGVELCPHQDLFAPFRAGLFLHGVPWVAPTAIRVASRRKAGNGARPSVRFRFRGDERSGISEAMAAAPRRWRERRAPHEAPAARHVCSTTPKPKPSSVKSGIMVAVRKDRADVVAGGATKISLLPEPEQARRLGRRLSFELVSLVRKTARWVLTNCSDSIFATTRTNEKRTVRPQCAIKISLRGNICWRFVFGICPRRFCSSNVFQVVDARIPVGMALCWNEARNSYRCQNQPCERGQNGEHQSFSSQANHSEPDNNLRYDEGNECQHGFTTSGVV